MSAPRRRVDHTRTSRIVLTGLWADAVLVMAASAWNGGQAFVALDQHIAEGIALGLAVDVGLAVALVGDRALHLAGRQSQWGRALRVSTAIMSLALNCAVSLWLGHYGVAVFHAFLPVLLVLLSEYAQDSTLQFGEVSAEHATAVKAEREAQLAADRAAWQAQQDKQAAAQVRTVPPPPPPVSAAAPARFQAVPDRTGFTPAVHPDPAPAVRPESSPRNGPADRSGPQSTRRTSPARKARKRRTDAQVTAAIHELAARNGGTPPSQYQVKQALGVGSGRAARLLAELGPAPAAAPAGNGAATRKDGSTP